MNRLMTAGTVGFFGFILWMIHLANTGGQSVFLEFTRGLPGGDKLAHLIMFGVLTLIVNRASGFRTLAVAGRRVYAGTLVVSVFVLLEELSQAFIPLRTLDALDLAADAAGIALFTWMSWWIQRRETRRRRVPAGR